MKDIKHESQADVSNYIYLKMSGIGKKSAERYDADKAIFDNEQEKENNPENQMIPSFHKAMEFWFVRRGKYAVYLNGERIELSEGDMLCIESYKAHYYVSQENASSIVLVIDDGFLKSMVGSGKTFPTLTKNKELFDQITGIVESVYDKWDKASAEQKIGTVYKILGSILYHVPTITGRDEFRGGEIAQQIVEYVCEHYSEPITIKSLAKKFGYSESYFSELFNRIAGVNLRDYLNAYRIAVADRIKEKHPEKSLREIAETVGYSSWTTFFRSYKKHSKFK